jgi:hypothetical protein
MIGECLAASGEALHLLETVAAVGQNVRQLSLELVPEVRACAMDEAILTWVADSRRRC